MMVGSLAQANELTGQSLKICSDGAGWPPYTYIKDGKTMGYDVDVLDAILTPAGVKFQVDMPPWKRCLVGTEGGKYHIALSASHNKEREEKFLMTRDYYTLHGSYFYAKKHHPSGIEITQPSDLLKHKICGLHGYNYSGFGIDTAKVDRSAQNFDQVSRKTKAGRCDMFLARFEILVGFKLMGKPYYDDQLEAKKVPGIEGDKFYMLISRKYPQADALKKLIDDGVTRLQQEGKLDSILQKYM